MSKANKNCDKITYWLEPLQTQRVQTKQ